MHGGARARDNCTMSVVTLQLGQCGNQVGCTLFNTLMDEMEGSGSTYHDVYFRDARAKKDEQQALTSRCVLIDMEPKVANQCLQSQHGLWQYDEKRTFTKQSGSGNNWAHGYNIHGREVSEKVLEVIQREVEECDFFGGFHALQSVAGGTGSGLGSCIAEHIADMYPKSPFLNTIVWPFQSGEVIVQNYNSVLSLASLVQASDGIVLFENDRMNEMCKKLLKLPNPTIGDLNSIIAQHLAMMLLPVSKVTGPSHGRTVRLLHDLTHHLCAHSGYKLLNVKMIPQMPQRSKAFSSYRWTGLLKHLYQMHRTNWALEEGIQWKTNTLTNRAVANVLIYR